jgi:tRNA A-37 threonylcarbamoyl transferase component Bud32
MARRKPAPEPQASCARCGHLAGPSSEAVNFCPACGAPLRAGARRRGGREKDGVVADRYRLVELLGEGGMGRVYKAEHIRMGKALALKLLREDFAREPAAAERFLAEARAVSRLSHPHTIAVFDFGEAGPRGGLYLAMEYVPGEDLAAVLRAGGPLPEARARELGRQILGSLAEAHEAGVVHRDMKPGNVMLMRTRSGEDFAKVLDFGIAALRDDTAAGAGDAIVGTPAYLAPEQARGAAVDGRTDLYALGCVLYELVAGRPPFVAPSPMAVVSAHLSQEPPALAKLAPGVSRAFAEVVHRALAKRPEDRFPSADAMREALVGTSGRAGHRARPGDGERDAGGGLASRADFDALAARVLRPGRIVLVLAALGLIGAAAVAWRWEHVHALLAARVPALAAALPAALQPAPRLDAAPGAPHGSPLLSPEREPAAPAASPPPIPAGEPPPDVEPSGAPQPETPEPAAEAGAGAPDDPSQEAEGGEPEASAPPQLEATPSSVPLEEEPEALEPGAPPRSGDALLEVVDGQGRLRLPFEPQLEAAAPLVEPSPVP